MKKTHSLPTVILLVLALSVSLLAGCSPQTAPSEGASGEQESTNEATSSTETDAAAVGTEAAADEPAPTEQEIYWHISWPSDIDYDNNYTVTIAGVNDNAVAGGYEPRPGNRVISVEFNYVSDRAGEGGIRWRQVAMIEKEYRLSLSLSAESGGALYYPVRVGGPGTEDVPYDSISIFFDIPKDIPVDQLYIRISDTKISLKGVPVS